MKNGLSLLFLIAFLSLLFPTAFAAVALPSPTPVDLNVTERDLTNWTVPAAYQPTPVPLRVEVTVSDSVIPGPKGEMQAGPRSIGFTITPGLFLLVLLAVAIVGAGVWYLRRGGGPETEEKDEERKEE